MFYGSGNDSRYGKIEIGERKEMGNPQPSTIIFEIRVCSSSARRWLAFIIFSLVSA